MGIPQHYSRELPERCLFLIESLLSAVNDLAIEGDEHLGPLTTTFLLAMSNPIITLPIERVERHRRRALNGLEGYADDRPLSPELTNAVDIALGENALEQSPFICAGAWRFSSIPYNEQQNVARYFPDDLAHALAMQDALEEARLMSASRWASCLRNSLAHGGVVYLDADGHQCFGQPTEMIGFVSAQYPKNNMRKPPERLVALRITRDDYLTFLRRWVGWLGESQLSLALAA